MTKTYAHLATQQDQQQQKENLKRKEAHELCRI